MIVFEIGYPESKKARTAFFRRFSLNAYWAGKHWAKRQQDAQEWHAMTISALHKAGIPRGAVQKPVRITFYWDDGLDIDNHAAMGKMIVDSLKDWIIANDTRRYFRSVQHEFWDGGRIRVVIEEYEHENR